MPLIACRIRKENSSRTRIEDLQPEARRGQIGLASAVNTGRACPRGEPKHKDAHTHRLTHTRDIRPGFYPEPLAMVVHDGRCLSTSGGDNLLS